MFSSVLSASPMTPAGQRSEVVWFTNLNMLHKVNVTSVCLHADVRKPGGDSFCFTLLILHSTSEDRCPPDCTTVMLERCYADLVLQ